MKQLLRVLVGSQAHGLANPQSDYDYRGVFIQPTQEILKLGNTKRTTSWVEGKIDDTSWELGHFLQMAVHCNPTILEVFLSPPMEETPDGKELRALFPHVWNSNDVKNAFVGYGLNQRKKFLNEKDNRPNKFAAAYLRSLVCGYYLLKEGTFPVNISHLSIGDTIKRFKEGNYSLGEVMDTCKAWEESLIQAYEGNPNKETNTEAVNEFLLRMRKKHW